MKKTAIALLTLAAGIMAASCQKEAEPEIKSFKPMTINAVSEGIGTETKTEMAYKYDILWSENDQIYVTDGTANDTFTLSDGKGTTNGTFTQDGEVTFTSEVQAYYPATMVQDGGLVWPAVQTNNQTVPMYSTKTVSGSVEDFNFTSLGSVLQIVFTTPQADVTLKSIEIKDATETMSGSFTVDEAGKAIITATDKAGITLNLGDGVNVSNKIAYFNIAVPAGNYQDLILTFTATNGTKCVMKNGRINIGHNTVGRLTLTGKTFKYDCPDGALPGVFSVSPTKQVYFSKGNLWADNDNALHFESNQYGFNRSYESSHVSHFTWSSTVSVSVGDNNSGDYLFCDEDHKVSVDGSNGVYYTLTPDEWHYLFCNHSYGRVSVNGVNGCVVAPDGFSGDIAGSYADDAALAENNLVFFPAAGGRMNFEVASPDEAIFYWTSSASKSDGAYIVKFSDSSKYYEYYDFRFYGFSVRLVANVK